MNKLLTIGMPVYNGGKWLHDSLDSLLGQTFDDFDIIISDNQSTDNTEQIVRSYAQNDRRIQYVRQPMNIGVFCNYDAVFEQCNTKYFKWASGNDICMPTMLEKCIAQLEDRDDAVLAYPTTVVFDAENEYEETYVEHLDLEIDDAVNRYRNLFKFLRLNNIMNGVIRTSDLRRTSLNRVVLGSDINMMAELMLLGPAVHIDEPLFLRRMSPETSVSAKDSDGRVAFYTCEPTQTQIFQESKLLAIALAGAIRTPRSWSVKLGASAHAMRRIVWNRRRITAEVKEAMKRYRR